MGRTLTEYEPWLTAEMLVQDGAEIDALAFAALVRAKVYIYVIEDASGPACVVTYSLPDRPRSVLTDTVWIREDLRGQNNLRAQIVAEIAADTGRSMVFGQAAPYLMTGWATPLPGPGIYHYGEVFCYAHPASEGSD